MSAKSLLYFSFLICVSDSARILAYFPLPSISHHVVYGTLTEELARRGHEVIVITTDPSPNPPKNYTEIVLHDKSYELWMAELVSAAKNREEMDSPLGAVPPLMKAMTKIVDYQISTQQFQTILEQHENYFDLLIVECVIPFSFSLTHKFKAPVIGISSMLGTLDNFAAVGVPTHPYLYPDVFSQYTGKLTLRQKLGSLYNYIKTKVLFRGFNLAMNGVAIKHFGEGIPTLKELEVENTDLLFLNAHPMLKGIRPLTHNAIILHGLQLNKTRKEIPKDLTDFLDAAEEGVIYFSMGSNLLIKNFPLEKLQLFMEVFKQLPFKVLLKFEDDYLPGQPENVKIMKWFPQMDLLGHKNIKLFITQGGQQSVDEAIFNKVPMIAIPIIADQDINSQRIQLHGLGVKLNFNSLTEEGLLDAIHTVASNASYKENVSKFSELIDDQEKSPLERALWWTEYLLRNKSAKHLRSPVAGITWTEFLFLDVIALIVGIILIITTLSLFSLMYVVKVFKSRRKIKIN